MKVQRRRSTRNPWRFHLLKLLLQFNGWESLELFLSDIFPLSSYQHTFLVVSCRRVDCTDTIITVNERWAQAPVLPPHLQPHLSHRLTVSPLNKLPLPTCFVCFGIRQQSLHTDCVRIHSIVCKTSFCFPHSFLCLFKSRCFPFWGFYPFFSCQPNFKLPPLIFQKWYQNSLVRFCREILSMKRIKKTGRKWE